MTFSDSDKIKIQRVKVFFDQLDRQTRKENIVENTAFDGISSDLLTFILNKCLKDNTSGYRISSYALGNITHSTRSRVRKRIIRMARFGLVKIKTEWRNDGSHKRKSMLVIPNPWLNYLLTPGSKPSHRQKALKEFVAMGIRRLESEEDLQGFRIDSPYGEDEPDKRESTSHQQTNSGEEKSDEQEAVESINELIANEDTSKAQKMQDIEEWRKRSTAFVESAAVIWQYSQSRQGFGNAKPNWCGDTKHMPPGARKERQELVKTFEQYGGKVTALAWYIFSCGVPKIDDRTNLPVFDPSVPHRQFATRDKKPSTFTKHFNSVLKDKFFVKCSKQDWPKTEASLRRYFNTLLDVKPRDGTNENDKVGYSFGDNSLQINEVS